MNSLCDLSRLCDDGASSGDDAESDLADDNADVVKKEVTKTDCEAASSSGSSAHPGGQDPHASFHTPKKGSSDSLRPGSPGASTTGDGQSAKKEQVDQPEDLALKVCAGCDCPITTLTLMDTQSNQTYRSWALRNYWGALCAWCVKMAKIKHPLLKTPAVMRLIIDESQKVQFRLFCFAYVSLREEGKVQITINQLEQRARMLMDFLTTFGAGAEAKSHFEIVLAGGCIKSLSSPNPVELQCPLVQVRVGSVYRLGFKIPAPRPAAGLRLPANVLAVQGLLCDDDEDLQAIGLLSTRAAADAALRKVDCAELDESMMKTRVSGGAKRGGRGRGGRASHVAARGLGCRVGAGDDCPADGSDDGEPDVAVAVDVVVTWPKHKHTKAIQRTYQRLDAIWLNFGSAEWEMGLSDATCRSNLKTALEQTTLLETCEFSELIERNVEHVNSWKLIQRFRSQFKEYSSVPTDEALSIMDGSLTAMSEKLAQLQSGLCPVLDKLRVHARFLHTLNESGIKVAITSLHLSSTPCLAMDVYMKFAKTTGDDVPCFAEWVETALAESAMKNLLRLMNMTVTSRSAELAKAHMVFELYNEVVYDLKSYFSASAVRRAAAMLCLSSSILGRRVSPSDVDTSVRALTTPKTHDIVKAYTHYKSGKEYMLHAHAVVERNADDVIADKLVRDVLTWFATFQDHDERFDVDFMVAKLPGMQIALQHMCEALPTWSEVRLEEQCQVICDAVTGIATAILLAEFGYVRQVTSILLNPCRKAEDEMSGFVAGLFDDTDYKLAMKSLRGAALRAQGLASKAVLLKYLPAVELFLQKTMPGVLVKVIFFS